MSVRLPRGTTALIPAAGPVSEGILALSNVSSPAMIPVAGRPVIHWTLNYLLELGVEDVRIGVSRPGLFVEDIVAASFGDRCSVQFVVVDHRGAVGDAVLALLPHDPAEGYLVVFGDTMFRLADNTALPTSEVPVLLTDEVEESYRWLTLEGNEDGTVRTFHDKEAGRSGPHEAAIGVLYVPDGIVMHKSAERLTAPIRFLDLIEAVSGDGLLTERAGEWLDCGNPDKQVEAQRALLQQRAFNSIDVDVMRGTLTKRSEARDKFLNELNYLRLVPTTLQALFPRLIDFDDRWESLSITMEFYGYPTLAELFVFENVDVSIWARVFRHLRSVVVDQFGAMRKPLSEGVCRQMYVDKVRARSESDLTEEVGDLMAVPTVFINGIEHHGLAETLRVLQPYVDRLDASAWGAVVHGDLCFGNILYDLRSGICKLIDPRGSFGDAGLYGDLRYDVAKLWHSVHGGYDLITAGLFRLQSSDNGRFEFSLLCRDAHAEIAEAFASEFFETFSRAEIALITALIFLGLPALHYDAPDRQVAFVLRGLQLAAEALELLKAESDAHMH
jgi:dTDP-glucose pyrophosphorylase